MRSANRRDNVVLKSADKRDVVFVLGAGASYADGAPLQSEILPYILSGSDNAIAGSEVGNLVNDFVSQNFHVGSEVCPSLESVFGFIDHFISHRESLGPIWDAHRLAEVRRSLVRLIHYVVAELSKQRSGTYHLFWKAARDHTMNIGVVTTNYDTLLDDAFDFLYPAYGLIDYCLPLLNYEWAERLSPDIDPFDWWINPREPTTVRGESDPSPVKIIKVHGSLNWKYCPSCGQVLLTPWNTFFDLAEERFLRREYASADLTLVLPHECPWDQTPFDTLIVPPSHSKRTDQPADQQVAR